MDQAKRFARREFLSRSAAVGGGLLALPGVLSAAISASPAEQVLTGHIGVGGRGGSLLGMVKAVAGLKPGAVSDVDGQRRAAAKRSAGGVEEHADYRRVLDRKDIDAVVVATPDHWHAKVTVEACAVGKDVYVEKPSSQNIREGRAMINAARKHSRVVQVGINHRSAEYNREIGRIIRGGRIGKVHAVRCWMWENRTKARTAPSKPPEHLDWNAWLGPAPAVAYHPDRSHYNFRWCRDYAGGYMTDWGVHMFNVITYAMDCDLVGPESVEAHGEFAADNIYDHPIRMRARWVFKEPEFELTWNQPSEGGDVLPGQPKGREHAMTFYGEDGELRTGFGAGYHKFFRDGKEAPLPREGKVVDVPLSPGHMQNWYDSIKSRAKPIADIEIGHRTTSLCLLANIAMFSGKNKLDWDWRKEEFIGDAEANDWVGRKPRAGFEF